MAIFIEMIFKWKKGLRGFHTMDETMIRLMSRLAEPALQSPAKGALVVVADAALCMLSIWLAFYLRLGEFYFLAGQPLLLVFSPMLLATLVAVGALCTAVNWVHLPINSWYGVTIK